MRTSLKVILFLLSNILGFWTGGLIIVLIAATNIVDLTALSVPGGIRLIDWFFPRVMFCWLICALFSLSSFFLKSGRWQIAFLLAPAIVPLIFGISLIASL